MKPVVEGRDTTARCAADAAFGLTRSTEIPAVQASSLASMVGQFRRGERSPVTVLRQLLDDIQADTAAINAFCLLDPDQAMAQAHAAQARYQAGAPLGPLDGVPVSVKDLVAVKGWPTRRGSLSSLADPVAEQDAPAVTLLRNAGSVIFGKTTTTEFGWTIGSTNPHAGVTRNPRSLEHSAGGSSSGAAAQVAAGWGAVALGSDAGGSVRIPASWCGVVGFKPTFGAIPLAPQSAFAEFAHLGLLTRSVADCAWAFSAMSGAHPLDPSSLYPRAGRSLPGRCLRIGWAMQFDADEMLDPTIDAAFRQFTSQLGAQGYEMQPVDLRTEGLAEDMWRVWQSRIYESFVDWSPEKLALLDPRLRGVYEAGAGLGHAALTRSRARLRTFATRVATLFSDIDVLLTPATSQVAPRLDAPVAASPDAENWFAGNGFAFPFNIAQMPALAMPLGVNASGLPFGLQVVGRRYEDEQVLRFAAELELHLQRTA
ncbi:amidase [Pusillimonas sp. NJUB218]|uniref:amidase n=1 Tax=Pusillimonas sp. NJUB218 TaxID=2023230 RepID=UPI000F4BF29B|nr:amidase family protein [Pusillimonas sp. NJUB218]ROT46625.1 hypothetical protein CHR62_01485 [Pusillimonas sp. NJUB218]